MVAFKRDDLHRETERYLANGLIQTNRYNDVGLLVSQIIQPEQETTDRLAQTSQLHQLHRQYHYDQNYLLTQVEDSRLGQLKYQYDQIGRLTKTQTPNYTESFSFDPAGNLIDPIATQMSQVKNNLVTQFQGKHYKYDAQGNMIESQEKGNQLKLSWDNLNRLVQSERNGQITEYGYDVFGRRLYKASKDHYGKDSLTLFGWDGELMVWESKQYQTETEKQQNYTKHYIYEPNSFVPVLQTGYRGFIQLIKTPDYSQFKSMPYSIHRDPVWSTDTRKNKAELERVAFYHCDQVGTPQTLSNEKGECIWEIELNTWGKVQQIKSQTESQDQVLEQTNIRFQGQYYDEETGLHYNRYRYYEPHSGRYISKDPIGLQGGLNNSAYVSDPNKSVDPMGLKSQLVKNHINLVSNCYASGQTNCTQYKAPTLKEKFDELLPSLPEGNEDNFGGFFWNRWVDGSVRNELLNYGAPYGDMVSNGAATNVLKRLPQTKDIINEEGFSYGLGKKITKGIEMSRGKGVAKVAQGVNLRRAAYNCTTCSNNIITQLHRTGQKKITSGVGRMAIDFVDIPGTLKGKATDGWFEIGDLIKDKLSNGKENK